MLSDIIKQSGGWDTKALVEIFSNKEFFGSIDGDKEKYLANLISICAVALPREIIPDDVTFNAFTFTYEKDPLTLPILLKYLTHKNLLKEAKDDLDKINQKLQDVIDKDLKDLQDKQKKLQANETDLNDKKIQGKEAKALAYDIQKINAEITKASSEIEKIKSYKKDIETLFKGGKVELSSYPPQYFSILNSGLIEIMEKKLTAYVKDDTDIEKIYQSLNSRAKKFKSRVKKIKMLIHIKMGAIIISFSFFTLTPFIIFIAGQYAWGAYPSMPVDSVQSLCSTYMLYSIVIGASIVATFFATAGVAYLIEMHYEQNFAKEMQDFIKEMQDFIEGPKYVDKATNTEDVEGLGQEEKKVNDGMNYKGKPSAPPYQPELYPDLSEVQPPSYKEACHTIVQPKDSKPSSNLDSAEPEQLKPDTDLLGSLSEQLNAKLGSVLCPLYR